MRFYTEKTPHSPLIKFEDGILLIAGRSIPEDSFTLYEPLFNFMERYADDFPSIEIQIKLEYANSSTNRSLMSLFELMLIHQDKGNKVAVLWYYASNDKEMYDLGSDFQELIQLPFEVRAVESLD